MLRYPERGRKDLQISSWSREADALPARAPHRLHSEAADPAHRRKRTETGRSVRPRRTEAGQLGRGRYGSDIGGLGNGSGTSPAARHAVVGCCPKTLVSIQLFFRHLIIV